MSRMPHNGYNLNVIRQNSDSIFDYETASSLSSEVDGVAEVMEERIASLDELDMDDLCGPGVFDDHEDNVAGTTGRDRSSRRRGSMSSQTSMGDVFGCANEDDVNNEISETEANMEVDGICGVVDDGEGDGGRTFVRAKRRDTMSSITSMSGVFSCGNENDVNKDDDEIKETERKMDEIFCELVEVENDGEEQYYYRLFDSNDKIKGEKTITQVDKETLEPSPPKLPHQIMESKFDSIFSKGLPEVVKLKLRHKQIEAQLDTIFYEKNRKPHFQTRHKRYRKTFDDIFSDDSSSRDRQSHSHSSYDADDHHPAATTTHRRRTLDICAFRKWCGRTVNHPKVQIFLIICIIINAIMLGIGTYEFVTANPDVDEIFETIDLLFLLMFSLECLMNFIHLGCDLFCDGWMVLDLTVILVSWIFASLQVLRSFRSFRLLRAFRIVRAVRLVTHLKMLRNLVVALTMVIPRMSAIIALMGIMFYVFAVLFTSLFKDMYGKGQVSVDYFGRMDKTLYTLFQIMTLDWANVAREVMVYYKWAWIPFVTFVCVSSFTVFNLIIAVICDAVSYLNREDKMKDISPEVQMKVHKLATEMMFLKKNHDTFHNTMKQLTELLKNQTVFEMNYVKPEMVHKKSSRWRLASFDGGHHRDEER